MDLTKKKKISFFLTLLCSESSNIEYFYWYVKVKELNKMIFCGSTTTHPVLDKKISGYSNINKQIAQCFESLSSYLPHSISLIQIRSSANRGANTWILQKLWAICLYVSLSLWFNLRRTATASRSRWLCLTLCGLAADAAAAATARLLPSATPHLNAKGCPRALIVVNLTGKWQIGHAEWHQKWQQHFPRQKKKEGTCW